MRACFRRTGNRRAAAFAKLPVHNIAAICAAGVIAQRSGQTDGIRWKNDIHRGIAGGKILAIAAPANASSYGFDLNGIPNRVAQTSTGNGHSYRPQSLVKE